ncbi:MAG: D-2-hydroxyacid dehydrogenase [Anaerolineales bacterium]|nr:D-2-hydroxyacid dehydrogenase [Anaerolineales bacterium]
MKTEVLIAFNISEKRAKKIEEQFPSINLHVVPAKTAEEIPDDLWEKTEVLYTENVFPVQSKAPALRWIQLNWAGIDGFTDIPILYDKRISVTNMSGANAIQVAEFIIAMILALGHHIPKLIANQKESEWPKDKWQQLQPVELFGSTVGIIGYGSIGRQVARLSHSAGASVLATKKDMMNPKDTGYTPENVGDPEGDYFQRLYPVQAVSSMVSDCDFVVVTTPLTKETTGLVNEKVLQKMKSSAFLIDISRGGIVNHNALIDALKNGVIAGAALDVFPEEPLPEDSPLWKMDNVIISPHNSGNSKEYMKRAVDLFSENLSRYLDKTPLYNVVNLEKGY